MKFDVVIGNPPYQLSSNETGIQAVPLYDKFVEQAKILQPNYLTMIIPSRWFTGGIGLDNFRKTMLTDRQIRTLVDYPKSRDCFPGVDIAGGVCYFLWNKESTGDCELISIQANKHVSKTRRLDEFDILVRDNIGIDIVHKIQSSTKMMSDMVFPISPFGISTKEHGKPTYFDDAIELISSAGSGFINKNKITKNANLIDKYKVIIGQLNPDRAGVNNSKDGKINVTTKVHVLEPNKIHSATYLLIGAFQDSNTATNCTSYIKTKFVRFLISLTLSSMHITKDSFRFVPLQNFDESWTDEKLYKKYGLTKQEIDFIESMIKPME